MKNAFAKLMEKNPTQSSQIAFRAGGNGVPILTRASSQSTTGYQTMGLPDGSRPMPGGGANRTTLGIYRMGESDGNGAPSAIIGNPGDIFPPITPGQRENPERTFANVGNNVFQPADDGTATHALLRRLGDQKFKAESMAPFEDYMAQQRLALDLNEASRNAGLNDLGVSREIIRNLAAQRRQQNEDDYLRKMLDAGATPEAARKEIEDVRNANALQEAKKVDDREYQAKTLIQRLAMSRGVTPMTREPLNQSSSIDNPQRSQAMSQAMGMPGEGFGTSPLDMNRQFMTPDFYKKFLRKSALTQESADEQTAFNNLLTSGEIKNPAGGAFSMATLRGQERQNQIELASEGLASRLETLRARGRRIIKPLPDNIVGEQVLKALYDRKDKAKTNKVLYSLETIQDMRPLQLLIAMNLLAVKGGPSKVADLKNIILAQGVLGSGGVPSQDLLTKFKTIVVELNAGEPNIEIPFASDSTNLPMSNVLTILDDIKTSNNTALARRSETARTEYEREMREIDASEIPLAEGPPLSMGRQLSAQELRDRRIQAISQVPASMTVAPVPGAPGVGGGGSTPARSSDGYENMTLKELKDELKRLKKPVSVKNKDEAIARLRG